MIRSARLHFLLLLSVSFASCKVYKQGVMFTTDTEHNAQRLNAEISKAERNYTIQAFDYITLEVFTNKGERIIDPDFELSKDLPINLLNNRSERFFIVKGDGTADLPMIGTTHMKGLKLHQADSLLQQKYNSFYGDTYVLTRIINKRVVILGAAGGHVIPFQNENMSLLEALALTSGIPERSKAHNIRLIRGDLNSPEVYIIDLSTIEGLKKSNMALQPGDVIYIEPLIRVFNETVRDAAPVIGVFTNLITLLFIIQSQLK